MSSIRIIYQGNDTLIELDGLKNKVNGQFINTATVDVTLKDEAGVDVTGETWPLSMAYLAGSNGVYRAILTNALGLSNKGRYVATINVDDSGSIAKWELNVQCQKRR